MGKRSESISFGHLIGCKVPLDPKIFRQDGNVQFYLKG